VKCEIGICVYLRDLLENLELDFSLETGDWRSDAGCGIWEMGYEM